MRHRCYSCGADWKAGEFKAGCAECGGGAMEIKCQICGGECAAVWVRAIDDSHEYGRGCWVQLAPCELIGSGEK